MGIALIIGGIVMWVVDARYGQNRGGGTEAAAAEELERMTLPQAVWIGLCQILSAVFPGTSRSMATIAAGPDLRIIANRGPRVFFSAFDPDHGGGNRIRSAESREGT